MNIRADNVPNLWYYAGYGENGSSLTLLYLKFAGGEMFKSDNPLTRLFWNFVLGSLLFYFFQAIGWFTITSSLPFLVIMLIIGVANVFSTLIVDFLTVIALPVIAALLLLTLGLGAFLLPGIIMYGVLYLTSYFTGLFAMNVGFWGAVGIGTAFALLRFTDPD